MNKQMRVDYWLERFYVLRRVQWNNWYRDIPLIMAAEHPMTGFLTNKAIEATLDLGGCLDSGILDHDELV